MGKKIATIFLIVSALMLSGCNEITEELKTQNNELRIAKASLEAQVEDLSRKLVVCKEENTKKLGTFNMNKINLDNNQGITP